MASLEVDPVVPDGIWYEIAGAGRPVVLTHGFGDDATTWDAVWPSLVADHRVLRWDLPGHGRSAGYSSDPADHSRDAGRAILAGMAASLAADEAPVVLVGHSLGGYLSMCHGVSFPGQIAGLVLVATGPGFRRPEAQARWNALTEKAAAGFGLEPQVAPLCRQDDAFVLDHLDRLTMPVEQLVGSEESHYDAGIALLDSRLHDVRSERVEGAKHHVQLTHPDHIVQAVRRLSAPR